MVLAALVGALLDGAVWGLAAAIVLATAAALVPALPSALRHAAPRGLAALACLFAAGLGVALLAGAPVVALEWWPGLPGEPFSIAPDALSAPFLLLFGLVGAGSFAAHAPHGGDAGARARLALHAAFALSLLTVFATRHALLFLVAWEGMTLASAALVASDLGSARARSATWVYLVLSQIGAALVALPLVMLSAKAGSFQYDALAAAWSTLPSGESALLAWLFTIGFAVKLGLVPAHVWLPMAHPEAPGPISALLSGVMVKAGLYGMLRFAWALPGAPPEHWGTVLMALGVATALTGALYATIEADAKRLLAYSTIKNAGLLALAVGLAALLAANGEPAIAGVALAAAFYHTLGHGLAKSLAFLSVAEAAHNAGSRHLDSLGGLARRMPRASLGALVSTLALCALPPFSCFAGEWLIFQALILGYSAGAGQLRLVVPFAGAAMALAGALAVAALVKLYGIGFLGRPRSEGAAAAHDVPRGIGALYAALAAMTLGWGLVAPWATAAVGAPIARLVPGFAVSSLRHMGGLALGSAGPVSASFSPLVAAALVLVFAGLAYAWLRTSGGGPLLVRRAPSWSCGQPLTARMQYSALGFTKPLRLIFEPVLKAHREIEVLEEGSPYFARRVRYHHAVPALYEQYLYQPFVQAVLWTSEQMRRLQTGSLHVYLAYLLVTLVALLMWAR